ncbi:MAG: hypothetical protein AAF789_02030 [Bacteroidota bacterium]
MKLLPNWAGYCMILSILFFSCKNQKKVSQITAPVEDEIETPAPVAPEDNMKTDEEEQEESVETTKQPERVIVSDLSKEEKINNSFSKITDAASINLANSTITETLALFESPDVPVLVIFYQANGKASYDQPTTIRKYLDYLKDTGNKPAQVEEMVMNDAGKIKELVLKK